MQCDVNRLCWSSSSHEQIHETQTLTRPVKTRQTADSETPTIMSNLVLKLMKYSVSHGLSLDQWRLVLKKCWGAQTNWKYGIWSKPLDLFLSSSKRLVKGIFVKIKLNFLSSGDIALASTLISTCLSTDELLLSGTRVVENGPITWGQTYKNNIDSL